MASNALPAVMIPTHTSQRPPEPEAPKLPIIQLPDHSCDSAHLQPEQHLAPHRSGHIHFGTCSPVSENGSFAFDQVLKSGKVNRRLKHKHAFRASWKSGYLVLRPNLLSIYKDEEATRLRLSITLSEVTAVAQVRSPRSDRQHVFGIFTPSKNYRFQASSEKDAEDWIQRIRSETRIDEDDEAFLAFTGTTKDKQPAYDTSEPSDADQIKSPKRRGSGRSMAGSSSRHLSCAPTCSAHDVTSFSEWSDVPISTAKMGSMSSFHDISTSAPAHHQSPINQNLDFGVPWNHEKVICHGYLQGLRIEGSVPQWKRRWAVLRAKSLAFYKDEQEYSAIKVIPMSQVIDAAEIDPLSRSKNFCFQIIDEEKTYRLCAPDEESLARWLGCLKSIIVVTRQNARTVRPASPA